MTITRWVRVGGLSLLLLGLAMTASAADETPGPIFDSPDALALAAVPVPFSIENPTQGTWQVIVSGNVLLPNGKSERLTVGLTEHAGSSSVKVKLGPVGEQLLFVGFSGTPPTAATGWLRLSATSSGTSVQHSRSVALTSAKFSPAVPSWNLRRVVSLFGDIKTTSQKVPLKNAGACPVDLKPVRVVVSTGTESAGLTGTCMAIPGGSLVLKLAVPPLGYGTYTGTLGAGDDKLAITIQSTRAWGLAVAFLLFGIVVAVMLRGLSSNETRRRLLGVLRNLAGDAKTKASDGDFNSANPILEVIEKERDRLRRELREAAPGGRHQIVVLRVVSWLVPFPADRVKTVNDGAKDRAIRLKSLIEGWEQYAKAWKELHDQPSPFTAFELAPQLERNLRAIVSSGAPATVDMGFADKLLGWFVEVMQVESTKKFLSHVTALKVATDRQVSEAPNPPSDDNWRRRLLAEAQIGCRRVLARLRRVESCGELAGVDLIELIGEWRDVLDSLPPLPALPQEQMMVETPSIAAAANWLVIPSLQPISRALSRFAAWTHSLAEPIGTTAAVLVPIIIAVAVAIVSGLQALYYDKVWATPRDMAYMAAWGFGTTAVLTPLFQAIEGATVGRLAAAPSTEAARTKAT